jgi:hypothetical protein
MLREELAAMEKEEERQQFVAQLAEPVEALVGQALIQLVRVQHNVKEEVLEALGGLREDLAGFREEFARALGNYDVRLDLAEGESGGVGVRVRADTRKRVWIKHAIGRGPGSTGVDIG